MATQEQVAPAVRIPGPPELLPGRPDAVVDLQSAAGAALVGGVWRTRNAEVREIDFVDVADHLGPGDVPNRTYDVVPHAEAAGFDDGDWRVLAPEETLLRLGNGRVSFTWYRIAVTLPERVGDTDVTGASVVFEIVIDDYAEVWVDGRLPLALGERGGQVVAGFNAPNRVLLTDDARPGQRFQLAVLGINGPISASPENYIWVRGATLDLYAAGRARPAVEVAMHVVHAAPRLDDILPADAALERVATGFAFTEGPVWTRDGALLFSSPDTNAIYRWSPQGRVDVFRSKSGYAGTDIGRYHQPGSNGLTFDPDGRLTLCQHGNRRVLRVEPHGNTTVLADRFGGRRLNSPNDLVYRSDGSLYFTDPPFGLPGVFADPDKELPFSGVFLVRPDGEVVLLDDELEGPNGLAFSPDERWLYVGNWDPVAKVIKRYEVLPDGRVGDASIFYDMTDAPGDDALDGLKVDVQGNVYACGPGGLWILSPDGERLATIGLPEEPHNLAWGDEDARTLYLTALTSIYRLRLRIPGIRPA
jgi:gluconolactonase